MSAVEPIRVFNDFLHVRQRGENSHVVWVLQARCSACANDGFARMPGPAMSSCEQALAEQLFRKAGWRLGRARKYDVCPTCVALDRQERSRAREERTRAKLADVFPPELKLLAAPQEAAAQEGAPATADAAAPVAESPREMTRADRRIIIAKLEEVYLDEEAGYADGWSDQRVAADFGVPRAWVARLRDENFGPEASSAQTRKLIADARAVLAEADRRAADMNTLAAELMKARDDLRQRVNDAERQIASLERLYK